MIIDLSSVSNHFIESNVVTNILSLKILDFIKNKRFDRFEEHCLNGTWVNPTSFHEFLTSNGFLLNLSSETIQYQESKTFLYVCEDVMVNIYSSKKGTLDIKITFLSREDNNAAHKTFLEKMTESIKQEKKETKDKIYMFCQNEQGTYISEIGKDYHPIVRENYSPSVLVQYDKILREFSKKESAGNIVIFRGDPGCGKTYLIRSLVGDLKDCACIYLSPAMLSGIAAPTLLTTLLDFSQEQDNKKIVLLLEDADQILAPRMNDNITDIATLLNLADGILGKILNIKIIATTNQSKQNFDQAILRPGRLLLNCEVGKLSLFECLSVFNRETGRKETASQVGLDRDIPAFKTLAEIYELTRQENPTFWNPEASSFYRKVGF